ncbi:MAG: heparinase II/III family protein [Albidovulum sp.]|nr:heparinase II/III family protein [Albidovulum sp.]
MSGLEFWPAAKGSSFWDGLWAKALPSASDVSMEAVRAEPWPSGSADKGRSLLEGAYYFNGVRFDIQESSIWDIRHDREGLQETVQSFDWLDDLASLRSLEAVAMARKWTGDWLSRFGAGRGAGWNPLVASRRATRMVANWNLLTAGSSGSPGGLAASIGGHTKFLRRRLKSQKMDWSRIEVLARLIRVELAIGDYGEPVAFETRMLADACSRVVDSDGGIVSRNPEELLRIGLLLIWVGGELSSKGVLPPAEIRNAVSRIAAVLRSLRHKSGELPRFHGGRAVADGLLDSFLSSSGSRGFAKGKLAMGYARLVGGDISIIVDAAPPPSGWNSDRGHASTLALEMHSRNHALVVNCGSAELFGAKRSVEWRETRSHSTVEVDHCSSSTMSSPWSLRRDDRDILVLVPKNVRVEQLPGKDGQTLIASHDGYRPFHGLTHMRRLGLDGFGRRLWGEDTIWPNSDEDRKVLNEAANKRNLSAFDCLTRFHLHYAVEAEISNLASEISLFTGDGDEWRFRFSGDARLDLEDSVYFDERSCVERKSKQIVLASIVAGAASQVSWSFEKIGGADAGVLQGSRH